MEEQSKSYSYPSDLTDAEWAILAPMLEEQRAKTPAGAPRRYPLRAVLDSIFYVVKSGCQWRMIPGDFGPKWQTSYGYFARLKRSGQWQFIHDTLADSVRENAGVSDSPSTVRIDSQSVKSVLKKLKLLVTMEERRFEELNAMRSSTVLVFLDD